MKANALRALAVAGALWLAGLAFAQSAPAPEGYVIGSAGGREAVICAPSSAPLVQLMAGRLADYLELRTGVRPQLISALPKEGSEGVVFLLARADGAEQSAVVGNQTAGRVGFFLRVDDFDATRSRLDAAGVEFVSPVREMPYGRVTVFVDVAGNRWDLLGE